MKMNKWKMLKRTQFVHSNSLTMCLIFHHPMYTQRFGEPVRHSIIKSNLNFTVYVKMCAHTHILQYTTFISLSFLLVSLDFGHKVPRFQASTEFTSKIFKLHRVVGRQSKSKSKNALHIAHRHIDRFLKSGLWYFIVAGIFRWFIFAISQMCVFSFSLLPILCLSFIKSQCRLLMLTHQPHRQWPAFI